MKESDLEIVITVDAAAEDAFKNINNVRAWWTENLEGASENLNDDFSVRFGDVHYSRQKLVEVVPNEKVVWLVTESKLSFVNKKEEWTNTRIVFEIFTENNKTHIRFSHLGLNPELECFGGCSNAWREYVAGSLLNLINTGKGEPAKKEKMVTKAIDV